MITLTGAPGIGKSRLGRELAGAVRGRFDGGVWLVELAAVKRPVGVARALAAALRVDEVAGERLIDAIARRIGARRVFVVLDNCEHLLGACAKLVETLLAGCPELRAVVTSREPLAVDGEVVWELAPLDLPVEQEVSPEALLGYPAVGLFVERATTVQPGFSLNAYVAPAVVEITRRLDGIPLAIELAAARVESLTPEEIAHHLDDRFGLLTNGATSELAHHQTLAAALDWSHELLSEPERALLRRLSVFRGGFGLEAAEAVCAGGEVEPGDVSELLARLVAKSLVVADSSEARQNRFGLLETVRLYAAERLEQAGEVAERRLSHARFYLALAERAEPELTGADQMEWLERLEAERANLRAALEWSLSHGEGELALRLAGALVLFWRVRCHFSEGRELLDAAVSASDGGKTAVRAKALWGAGFMAVMLGENQQAVPLLEDSLSLFKDLGELSGCARALLLLGNCMQYIDPEKAPSLLGESATLAREAGDWWCLAHALGIAGLGHGSRSALAAARPLLEECLLVAREAEDKQGLRLGLFGLGSVASRQGELQLAQSVLEEAVALTRDLREDYSIATALQYLGQVAGARGDYRTARQLLDEAVSMLHEVGPPDAPVDALTFLADVRAADGDREGARLLFERALGIARDSGRVHVPALQGLGDLAAEEGRYDAARRLHEEALELARTRGGKGSTARALHGLGELARAEGELELAAELHGEALELQMEIGCVPEIISSLEALGGAAAASGRYGAAARLLGAAGASRDNCGLARSPSEAARHQADIAMVRDGLGARRFEATFSQGARLSLEEAAALAVERRESEQPDSDGWLSLTKSERCVATLVGDGLTNPQIAERLFVSRGTIKFHLSNIFRKLGVAGRMELAQEVWRRQEEARRGGP